MFHFRFVKQVNVLNNSKNDIPRKCKPYFVLYYVVQYHTEVFVKLK